MIIEAASSNRARNARPPQRSPVPIMTRPVNTSPPVEVITNLTRRPPAVLTSATAHGCWVHALENETRRRTRFASADRIAVGGPEYEAWVACRSHVPAGTNGSFALAGAASAASATRATGIERLTAP